MCEQHFFSEKVLKAWRISYPKGVSSVVRGSVSVLTLLVAVRHGARRKQRRFRHRRGGIYGRLQIAPLSSATRVKRRVEFAALDYVDWPNRRPGSAVLI